MSLVERCWMITSKFSVIAILIITGICSTIILMQVPKLMGGTAGTGELLELLEHIEKTAEQRQKTCKNTGGDAGFFALRMQPQGYRIQTVR